ncbi:HeH/LEM domain-containing protein [Facklamia hominis]|uniref:HeH/LEM domain-containing protein n=1 Tax=Facklamia hominis TaxID=178214 RepID=UPI0038FCD9FB
MAYKSLMDWTDRQTKQKYKFNDDFDSENVSEGRMAELLSPFNSIGRPVIRWVDVPGEVDSNDLTVEQPEVDPNDLTVEEPEIDPNELTVEQIKSLLDAKGIEYKSNAKKDELVALLTQE